MDKIFFSSVKTATSPAAFYSTRIREKHIYRRPNKAVFLIILKTFRNDFVSNFLLFLDYNFYSIACTYPSFYITPITFNIVDFTLLYFPRLYFHFHRSCVVECFARPSTHKPKSPSLRCHLPPTSLLILHKLSI